MDNESRHESRQSRFILRPRLKSSLSWLQPFVSESSVLDESNEDRRKDIHPLAAIILRVLCVLGLAIQTTSLVITIQANSHQSETIALEVLWILTVVILAISRPRTTSFVLAVLLSSILFMYLAIGISRWMNRTSSSLWSIDQIAPLGGTITSLLATVITINMPMRDPKLSKENISRPFTTPTKEYRSPEDNLTLWQWMTVSWMGPMITIGSKRQLNDEDVWLLPFEFQHRQLHDAFRQLRGTVFRRLIRANCIDIIILSLLALLELTANYSIPLMLQVLLIAMENLKAQKESAIFWSALIMLARFIAAQSAVFSLWFSRRCYERSRGEMITMLYEKTLNRKILGSVMEEKEKAETDSRDGSDTRREQNGEIDLIENDGLLNGDVEEIDGV